MKRTNCLLLMLLFYYTTSFAQRQYGEILPMQSICPCEAAKFFKTRQDINNVIRPFSMSSNCFIPLPVTVYSDGAYFFKKRKKRNKAQFPKGSHIIPN